MRKSGRLQLAAWTLQGGDQDRAHLLAKEPVAQDRTADRGIGRTEEGQDHEVVIINQGHEAETANQDQVVGIEGQVHVEGIVDRGLAARIVIERARETAVHEQGVESERDIETKGESIGHEVEIDTEGVVVKIETDREARNSEQRRH